MFNLINCYKNKTKSDDFLHTCRKKKGRRLFDDFNEDLIEISVGRGKGRSLNPPGTEGAIENNERSRSISFISNSIRCMLML